MAAHQLAIAKASLSAALLRPDPTSVPRDDIATFHALLDSALSHCSRTNVQTCKEWLLQHIVSSPNRAGVLGKYLSALSASFELAPSKPGKAGPSAKRRRLHILYLLNDVLHHTKYHTNEGVSAFVNFSSSLQPHAIDLVGLAALYDRKKNPKHHQRLDALLDLWYDDGYYAAEYINKLRAMVKNSESVDVIKASVGLPEGAGAGAGDAQSKGSRRDAPYIMPASHGDASTPYYDLPAGNFVPHIIPDSNTPIRPDTVKPLQFLAGPADQKLVGVLKDFFRDVDRIYKLNESDTSENTSLDIDELGQAVVRDERTGEITEGETYYGWSREFCMQMKKRNAKRFSSRSPSRSPSGDERGRRRRYSDSRSPESRSWSPDQRRYSRSRSSNVSREDYRSRSRSKSYSPRPASPPRSVPNAQQQNFQPPVPPPKHSLPPNPLYQFNAPASFPPQFSANAPPPAPPPMGYNAPWPTPHAPPPPAMFPAGIMPPGLANFPQQHQQPSNNQANQYARSGQPPMNAFPPPWQGGNHGGYNQGGHR